MQKHTIISFVVLLKVVLVWSGCAISRIDGIDRVRDMSERREAYGLSVLPPQVEDVRYYSRRVFEQIYDTNLSIAYSKRMRESHRSAFSFGVEYVHKFNFRDSEPGFVEMVNVYLRSELHRAVWMHLVRNVDLQPVEYLGLPAVRYRLLRVHDEGFFNGEHREEIGYLFRHPENSHWFVRVYYMDSYNVRLEQSPDEGMRAVGEEFLRNVRRVPLTAEESAVIDGRETTAFLVEGRDLVELALFDIYKDHLLSADVKLRIAERSYQETEDVYGLNRVLLVRGQLLKFRGEFEASLQDTTEALEFFRAQSMHFYEAICYGNIGHVHAIEGRDSDACFYFREAIEAYQRGKAQDRRGRVPMYSGSGDFLTEKRSFLEQLGCSQ